MGCGVRADGAGPSDLLSLRMTPPFRSRRVRPCLRRRALLSCVGMSHLVKALANLGYGTRREVERLIEQRRVTDARGVPLSAASPFVHDDVRVNQEALDPRPGSVVLLHKPVGYVCATVDDTHPTIYDLLPPRFRYRKPIMASIGRLDQDTTGVLLITDDGALNHRLTSPRSHQPKTYVAELAQPLQGDEVALFASGTFRLASEPTPLAPAHLEVITPQRVQLTVHEGRYHQVRRMFAATGNHVESLERVEMAGIRLGSLTLGAWRALNADELAKVHATTAKGRVVDGV